MLRRNFLATGMAAATALELTHQPFAFTQETQVNMDRHHVSELFVATFRFDVSPPLGHGCCGNWIKPIEGYDDPLEAIGMVITGAGQPIVICSVDWTGILNEAHVAWRMALAEAAGTTPDRVAVQVVHQHNAPFACLETAKIIADMGDLPPILDLSFFHRCLDQASIAVKQSMSRMQRVTHVGHGESKVQEVAANRRILDARGVVRASRGSSCKDPELRSLPEGLIDPMLKTVAFYNGDHKIVSCHYYACHPMSYYGDGRASSDFCGLARKKRQGEEPGCTHIYFNGCGGNIGAGKYNDGSKEMRPILTQRIYDGILASESSIRRTPIASVTWNTDQMVPQVADHWMENEILSKTQDRSQSIVNRSRPAYTVAWIRRAAKQIPIVLSSLRINNVSMLFLPAEAFVEYQLNAQAFVPDQFVATAAYGDGGPWYIPTSQAYPEQGYEVSVAWCPPEIDLRLSTGIRSLLA